MEMSALKKVTTIDDRALEADTSLEACAEFDFKPNQRIIDPNDNDRPGTIIGVTSMPEDSECVDQDVNILLVAMDGDKGKVCFFPDPAHYLRKQ